MLLVNCGVCGIPIEDFCEKTQKYKTTRKCCFNAACIAEAKKRRREAKPEKIKLIGKRKPAAPIRVPEVKKIIEPVIQKSEDIPHEPVSDYQKLITRIKTDRSKQLQKIKYEEKNILFSRGTFFAGNEFRFLIPLLCIRALKFHISHEEKINIDKIKESIKNVFYFADDDFKQLREDDVLWLVDLIDCFSPEGMYFGFKDHNTLFTDCGLWYIVEPEIKKKKVPMVKLQNCIV